MEACEDAPRSSLDGPRGRRSPEVGPTWQGRREGAPRAVRGQGALRTNMRELRTLLLNALGTAPVNLRTFVLNS